VSERAQLRILLVAASLVSLSNGAIFGLMARIQDASGFDDWGLGIVAGAFSGAQVASQLLFSHHADSGHTKRLLMLGTTIALLGVALVGLSNEFVLIVVGRIIAGGGFGVSIVASRRVVLSFDSEDTGARLGLLLSAGIGGFVLGAPLAIQLAALTDEKTPFVLIALLGACSLIWLARIPEPQVVQGGTLPSAGELLRLLRGKGIRAALYPGCAIFLVIGVFEALWARYLTDLGASENLISVTMLAFGVPIALLAPLGGRLAQRYGALRSARLAVLISAPIMVSYGLTSSIVWLAVIAFMHGIPDSVTMPGSQVAIADAAPAHLEASAQGLLDASAGLFAMTAALVAAPIYQAYGATVTFGITGFAMVLLALLSFWEEKSAVRGATPEEPAVRLERFPAP
jgi:MFS transporter, DHA1 family, tetracycline resistance protein